MYDCDCEDCKTRPHTALNLAIGDDFKSILKRVETAFKHLHKKGSYKPEDIGEVKAYQDLIKETASLLNGAIKDNDIPEAMLKSLKEDVFMFSGIKAHAELLEASRLLLNDDGSIKPFAQFANEVKGVEETHRRYLEAEYEFAVSSAQMAGKWADVSNDFDLQYRTAKDDRVRVSHKALDETTLPADNVFWKSYYPPNGWRCRCNAVQVRKGKYENSDPEASIKAGEKATTQIGKDGKNKLEIFRFNPGIEKKVFPPNHPYNRTKGAAKAKPIISSMIGDDAKNERKLANKEVKNWIKSNIPEHGTTLNKDNFKLKKVVVLRKNVKAISDHFTNPNLKLMAKDIFSIIDRSKYLTTAKLDESMKGKAHENIESKRARGVIGYNYYQFKWNDESFRLNVEIIDGKEYPYTVNKMVNPK